LNLELLKAACRQARHQSTLRRRANSIGSYEPAAGMASRRSTSLPAARGRSRLPVQRRHPFDLATDG